MKDHPTKVDTKEFEMPETVFSRDIESRVIQVIILNCLGKIEGVNLVGGNLIDTLFGREVERAKGIFVEQDTRNHLVKVKAEVFIDYGVSIPQKSEEVQARIVEEITRLTGLHVALVHLIIKGLNPPRDKDGKNLSEVLLEEDELQESEEYSKPF